MKIANYDDKTLTRYLELKNKRSVLAEEGLPILEQLRDKRGISSQEASYGKGIIRDFEEIDSEIREIERQAGGSPEQTDPIKLDPEDTIRELGGNLSNRHDTPIGKTYRGLFHGDKAISLSKGSFENFEEFLQVVSTGRHDPRLTEKSVRAMTIGDDSEGGFLVPDEFAAFLMDASLEREIVRPRAKVWPMKSQMLKVPGWSGFDHTTNVYGGFAGTWLAEGGTATRQAPKLRQIQLIAKKLAIYTQASRELREDGISFEAQLADAMTSATAFYLDYAFFTGDGVGKPLGILNDPALVTVAKESAQAASTVVYQNICKMLARLHPSAFKNAVWVANQTCLPQFMTMTIEVGTAGGSHIKAVAEQNGRFTLLGKELLFTEKLPILGTKGDVFLVDLSKYVIGMRKELVFDKSNAPGFLEDLTDYRTILRCDGQGSWSSAVTPKNGDSLSWCVTLATRGA